MNLIGRQVLEGFKRKHTDAISALEAWEQAARATHWANFAELKATFGTADQVKIKRELVITIFNIGGNKYRLISEVSYALKVVRVLLVLTHSQYSRDRWKENL